MEGMTPVKKKRDDDVTRFAKREGYERVSNLAIISLCLLILLSAIRALIPHAS